MAGNGASEREIFSWTMRQNELRWGFADGIRILIEMRANFSEESRKIMENFLN